MNLGLPIESPHTGNSGLDPAGSPVSGTVPGTAAGAAASAGAAGNAGALFGQLMAKALQLQAQQGVAAGQTGTPTGSPAPTEEGLMQALSDPAQPEKADENTEDSLLALPGWLAPWPGMPNVQHIPVGPSLQAITAGTPAPDAGSVTAFARQQGLDAEAIAWLMNPALKNPDGATPGAAPTLMSAPPLHLSRLFPTQAASPASVGPASVGPVTVGPVTVGPVTVGPVSAGPVSTGTGVAPQVSVSQQSLAQAAFAAGALLSNSPLSNDRVSAGPVSPGTVSPGTAGAPQVSVSQQSLAQAAFAAGQLAGAWLQAGPPAPASAPSTPAPVTDPSGADAASAALQSVLRWGQGQTVLLSQTAAGRNAAQSPPASPGANASWSESVLDLGELGLGDLLNGLDGDLAEDAAAWSTGESAEGNGTGHADLAAWQRPAGATPHARSEIAPNAAAASTLGSDQMQQLSEQMADAIGERMLRELERGHWSIRLMLKPAHLGHIEVEMRLRGGELDAAFMAPLAATRELLQDGLSRLKDSLGQAGMDVANLHVKDGQNRQNGGDSTPGQRQFAQSNKEAPSAHAPVPSAEPARSRPRRADGWDVMV